MTLPSGGALTLAQIHAEFGRGTSLAAYRGVQWWTDAGSTGAFSGGAIAVAEFYAKRATSPVAAGGQSFTSPGSTSFIVPSYNSLTVVVGGAGGGGGGTTSDGGAGAASSFNGSVIGQGGSGGGIGVGIGTGSSGANGTGSGGDSNVTGGGAAGGTGSESENGDKSGVYATNGGNAGYGGRAVKTYAPGALTVGASISVVIGAAGGPGTGPWNLVPPTAGAAGWVTITWS